MFRSLLVPLDGTPFGEHALPLAVAVARRTGAGLHLAHVHVPTAVFAGHVRLGPGQDHHERTAERAYLTEVSGRLAALAPGAALDMKLIDGAREDNLADALLAHAAAVGADLIVLSSHGRTGLARWWSGNVADDLAHHTALPLLVAPPAEGPARWEPAPALRNVLVGLDGSPLSEKILDAVLALGAGTASVTLLHTVAPAAVPLTDPPFAGSAAVEASVVDSQLAAGRAYVEGVAGRLRQRAGGVQVRAQAVLDAEPAEALLGLLRRPGFDLVALATHGRSGLGRLLLGSVAARVLKHSPVPVLLQRPGEPNP